MKNLKVQSFIASLFSVIFSLSIAKQLVGIVTTPILVLLFIFTILFLLYNEDRKVKELRRQARKRNFSWTVIVLTLFISIGMSSVGIYLWTNKTFEKSIKNDGKQQAEISLIESDYNTKIDEIRSSSIETEEYIQLNKDIDWWKRRSPANLDERADRNNQISILQERRADILKHYSEQKSNQINLLKNEKNQRLAETKTTYNGVSRKLSFDNYISFIFILLVLITEFVIINLQRELGRYYNETDSAELKIIKDLLNQGLETITIDDINYSKFADFKANEKYKKSKNLFNLLFSLGILTDMETITQGDKKVPAGKFIGKNEAVKRLRDYYFKANNLKK